MRRIFSHWCVGAVVPVVAGGTNAVDIFNVNDTINIMARPLSKYLRKDMVAIVCGGDVEQAWSLTMLTAMKQFTL